MDYITADGKVDAFICCFFFVMRWFRWNNRQTDMLNGTDHTSIYSWAVKWVHRKKILYNEKHSILQHKEIISCFNLTGARKKNFISFIWKWMFFNFISNSKVGRILWSKQMFCIQNNSMQCIKFFSWFSMVRVFENGHFFRVIHWIDMCVVNGRVHRAQVERAI